jgi:NSS family neurotransmitter:Na+ symporter
VKRVSWGTRLGFYLAAVGSAFGLGNLWRFPYIVSENGGGAFVLVYIFLACVIGVSLLVGELILGKLSRRSVTSAMNVHYGSAKGATKSLWRYAGRFAVLLCLIVLSYYAVISGWVLHFVMQLMVRIMSHQSVDPTPMLEALRHNGWLQVALTSVHLLVTMLVVLKGVEEGLEKWIGYIMPVFAILLLLLIAKTMSLPTAPNALRFLFYPDFSALNWSSLIQALGHLFFTLSIGFGSMVTFGSYMRGDEHIPSAAFRVTALDTLISLLAGLLIFPIMLTSSRVQGGPEVLFESLPLLFQRMEGGPIFGVAFFICLYLAALAASIGLLENVVSNLIDKFKYTRAQAGWGAGGVAFVLGIFPALASSVFRDFTFQGRNLLGLLDDVIINWLLPLAALAIAFYVARVLPEEAKAKEFITDVPSAKLYSNWRFVMRYFAPGIIILAFVLQIIGLFVR